MTDRTQTRAAVNAPSSYQAAETSYENTTKELPKRMSDDELATAKIEDFQAQASAPLPSRGPASLTLSASPEVQTVLSLVNTGNELSSADFIQLHDSMNIPRDLDINRPIIVRTEKGHMIVQPIIKDGKIVSFKYLSQVPVQDVERFIVAQDLQIQDEARRLVKYESLKGLLDKR